MTTNTNTINDVNALRKAQPNRPVHVTESYPGWYDNWGQNHHTQNVNTFQNILNDLLFRGDASINIYMFFGGTNYGWQAAGEGPSRQPVTTSYDYDGVLSEAGECIKSTFWLFSYWLTSIIASSRDQTFGHLQLKSLQLSRNFFIQ